ncbi:MAG: ABC transporter ATP-binding protein [Calditrichaeota bacterium]|nr:ABC transporter ATP-binding protein [Calditrichota bacterium]
MASLTLCDVSYTWLGSSQPVLRNLNFRLSSGELCVLWGKNGSGKSTLAQLLAGLVEPSSGSLIISRSNRSDNCPIVGLLMQDPQSQIMASNAEREIAWGLENLGLDRACIRERVERTIEQFELTRLRFAALDTLSDGQRQLIVLAAIIAMQPDFLILDEATAHLDPDWANRVWYIAEKYSTDAGVLWITSRRMTASRTTRCMHLKDGTLITQ